MSAATAGTRALFINLPETCQHSTACSYTGEAGDPKHLKEPKHSTTVRNQNTSQQYCTVLLLVFVSLFVLLDFY